MMVASSPQEKHLNFMRQIEMLKAELAFEQKIKDAALGTITEIVRALNNGDEVTIQDQWGEVAKAQPKPKPKEDQ